MSIQRAGYCVLAGRPNVGKSTLINRLVGQKLAITSRKPQTTRHSILGVKSLEGGQILFVDTPGMHQRGDQPMNRYLNRAARSAMADVDIILLVVEALQWTLEDAKVLESIIPMTAVKLAAVNKIDRVKDKSVLLPFFDELRSRHDFAEIIPISAESGDNVDLLEQKILDLMPEGEPLFPGDQLTDRNERFFAAEFVREQLIRRYAKEIPYALTVEIEDFKASDGIYRISALVWVEKEGQKNIIIGKRGAALKEVAQNARIEMERFFGTKVFLQIWVKVKKSWSSDENALVRLGYGD